MPPRTKAAAPIGVPAFEQLRQRVSLSLHATADTERFWPYQGDVAGFITEALGEHLWSKQLEIARSIDANRRTAVQSCHGIGKSWLAARVAAAWLSSNRPGEAFVVSSAPTATQVRAILWREINRAHKRGRLPGRTNQTEWWLDGELVGYGRKPADYDPTAFQGIHARRVLLLFDEACGMPAPLWTAGHSLVSNAESRWLVIGNPDDPQAHFAKICAPGSGWNVIKVAAHESPNFTGEWVPDDLRPLLTSPLYAEELARDVGVNSPIYISKVGGEFPEQLSNGLITASQVRTAQSYDGELLPTTEADELAADIARSDDGDTTVIMHRRGRRARVLWSGHEPDLMKTVGRLVQYRAETNARLIKVDDCGVGGGVTDRLRELNEPVMPINVGWPAQNPDRFLNLRAELYWGLRGRFVDGMVDLDPSDDALASQLQQIAYFVDSRGRIYIESKDDMRKRGIKSPDRADTLMLAFGHVGREPGDYGITI